MSQKQKSLFSRLKSYRARQRRQRIYIVPSISGLVLMILIGATYILSFADRNPWLMSLSVSGFVWFVIALFLTHKMLSGLDLTPEGLIINYDDEAKHGLRLDGTEIPEVPALGRLRVAIPAHKKRYRISSFSPTGLFYSWRFQKTKRSDTSDLGEVSRYLRGNPLARVDWKFWFRRGRFEATALDPGLRLRPVEEIKPDPHRVWSAKQRQVASDAAVWAFLWSAIVLLTLSTLSMHYAPLWTGVLFFTWVALSGPGLFVSEKFRYWGRINFFISWIVLTLVMVTAKDYLEPWMISTSSIAILFIPFALHLKISGSGNLMKKLRTVGGIAVLTVAVLFTVRTLISDRFRIWGGYYGGSSGSNVNWGASLSSNTLKSAEKFLVRGQGIFWVDFPRELQVSYLKKLPYWRETTYTESLGGLNWTWKVLPADAGAPINVNLFLPGRPALELQRQPPSTLEQPALTAYDEPKGRRTRVYSPAVLHLAKSLQLDPKKPLEASERVIQWLRAGKFEYTLRPGKMADIDEFLFQRKKGLCQHYAGALAYILKAADVPARVVAGYQGGEVDPTEETLLMRDYDAHAWVEVWNHAAGAWVLVDPTSALFPNQYRSMPGGRALNAMTRAIVFLQSRWAKMNLRLELLVLWAGGALALFFLIVGLLHQKWKARSNDFLVSIPKVRAWERKMEKRFHKRRQRSESLSAYYERLTRDDPANPKLAELKHELEQLNRQLYAA